MLNWSRVSSETLHQAQLNFSSGRIVPGGSRITDGDTGNYMVNPRKRPNLLASMGAYADSHVRPEDVRKLVKDDIVRRSSMRELELSHYAFNDTTTTQSFKQNVSSATMDDAMVLEKISHDLLDDSDMEMEPTVAAEDAILMSTINSLSSLLQPQEVDPDTASSGAGGVSS